MRSALTAIGLLAVLASCDGITDSRPGPPAEIEVLDAGTRQGVAGAPLAQPVRVRVTDARGRPVAGEVVNFVVTGGGGSVSVPSVSTDDEGIAATTWTLGTVAGAAQTLEARIGGPGGQMLASMPIAASAVAGPPAQVTPIPADTLVSGVVGSLMDDTLAVQVRDQHGNPVAGTPVQWTVLTGGGSIPALAAVTDGQGVARARWTLGPEQTAYHRAQASAGSAPPVRFSARVATTMTVVAAPASAGTAGTAAGTASVKVTGPSGDIPGLPVRWTAGQGGTTSTTVSRTGTNGTAATQWTFGGPAGGTQTLVASSGALQQTFTAEVVGAGTRTLVAEVPGVVLDADGSRVLWTQEQPVGTVTARLRQGGNDVTIGSASGYSGVLVPGGALLMRLQSGVRTLVEFRDGTATDRGPVTALAAAGDWAAWAISDQGPVLRQHVPSGAIDTVAARDANVRRITLDVAADGEVAYNLHYGGNGGGQSRLLRYRNGTSSQVFNSFSYAALSPRTDGVNVLFQVLPSVGGVQLWIAGPSGIRTLSSSPGVMQHPVPSGDVAGGWVGYQRIVPVSGGSVPYSSTARRIAPDGSEHTVDSPGMVFAIDKIDGSGTLVYQGGAYAPAWQRTRRYIQPVGAPPSDVGPAAAGERVVLRGGEFLLLSGGTVYRLAP